MVKHLMAIRENGVWNPISVTDRYGTVVPLKNPADGSVVAYVCWRAGDDYEELVEYIRKNPRDGRFFVIIDTEDEVCIYNACQKLPDLIQAERNAMVTGSKVTLEAVILTFVCSGGRYQAFGFRHTPPTGFLDIAKKNGKWTVISA